MLEIILQLHGGSGGGGTQIKSNAPGSNAAATISNATDQQRQQLREQLSAARGKQYTNKTQGLGYDSIKKALLGE